MVMRRIISYYSGERVEEGEPLTDNSWSGYRVGGQPLEFSKFLSVSLVVSVKGYHMWPVYGRAYVVCFGFTLQDEIDSNGRHSRLLSIV
jgi:hypothetical protein